MDYPPVSFQHLSLACRALITRGLDDEGFGTICGQIPSYCSSSSLTSSPSAVGCPPSHGSTFTGTSLPDPLSSKPSEASETESHVTEPPWTSTGALLDTLFSPALDHVRELKPPPALPLHLGDTSAQPTSKVPQIPTGTGKFPSPVAVAERLLRIWCLLSEGSLGLILVSDGIASVFIRLLTNSHVIFTISTVAPHDGKVYPPAVNPTRQRRRPSNMLSLYIPKS